MTEEEIEVVAQELAKVGGSAWYPGRTGGVLLRAVGDRYRDRARVAIAALDRLRASGPISSLHTTPDPRNGDSGHSTAPQDSLQVGSVVVYRPPGEKRAIPCRIERVESGQAYLVPIPSPAIGWVTLDGLQPLDAEQASKPFENPPY